MDSLSGSPTLDFLLQTGIVVIILIIGQRLAGFSRTWVKRALVTTDLTESLVNVSYSDDLRLVQQILEDMLAADEHVLAEPPATVVVLDFEDSGIKMGIRPFVKLENYWDVQFDLRERIKARFDEVGITIPFPQRDVHMAPAEINRHKYTK